MNIKKTAIEGVAIIDLEPRVDERGYFSRVFCKEELEKAGISFDIVQINRSLSIKKGMIRGLHYQRTPFEEGKIVQCLRGEIFDVALDLRKESKTYGQWVGVRLSEENKRLLVVPKGCAHGFQALTANCVVEYFVSQFYTPGSEAGVRWNDPAFGIPWPIATPILSRKDEAWPDLSIL